MALTGPIVSWPPSHGLAALLACWPPPAGSMPRPRRRWRPRRGSPRREPPGAGAGSGVARASRDVCAGGAVAAAWTAVGITAKRAWGAGEVGGG
jgi:hypothetical protein